MTMNSTYRNNIADHGAGLITHIGLMDSTGTELSSASYARQAVTWTAASDGTIQPDADLVFDLASGDEVAEWRGFSASTGGTDYGGESVTTVTFSEDGTYTLLSAETGIKHAAV